MNWSDFHFLRPWWLLAFAIFYFLPRIRNFISMRDNSWQNVVDAHLLRHLQGDIDKKTTKLPVLLIIIVMTSVILALSGPSWERMPQKTYKIKSPIVISLDMSASMLAKDVEPNRMTRALFKLHDILNTAKGRQVALIAYSDQPFVVSPLGDDIEVIKNFIPMLTPNIMPGKGSRPDLAIKKAIELLKNTNTPKGKIILLTDGSGSDKDKSIRAAKEAKSYGYNVSILAIGSEQGAPVPDPNGGFINDMQGNMVIAKTNFDDLFEITQAGNGSFSKMLSTSSDAKLVLSDDLKDKNQLLQSKELTDIKADTWKDQGAWLLIIPLIIMPFAFRRGFLFIFLAMVIASNSAYAFGIKDLFLSKDQQALSAYKADDFNQAADKFKNDKWRGASLFRAERFKEAANAFKNSGDIESTYNLGNALAFSNKYEDAIKAYDEVLKKNPNHEDAKYNKEIVKKLLQQSKDKKNDQDKNKNNQDNKNNKNDKNKDKKQNQNGQSDQNKNQDQKDNKDNKEGDNKNRSKDSKSKDQNQKDDKDKKSDKSDQNQKDDKDKKSDKSDQNKQDQKKNKDEQKSDKKDKPSNQDKQEKPAKGKNDDQKQDQDQKQKQQKQQKPKAGQDGQPKPAKISEDEQQTRQMLRRIPDDPGGLLREKIRRAYERKKIKQTEEQYW